MIGELQSFIDELKADGRFEHVVDDLEHVAAEMYEESCGSIDALEFFSALEWVAVQPRSVRERLEAMAKISALDGEVKISSLSQFLGWDLQ